MPRYRLNAIRYLAAPEQAFWRWSDDGGLVEWRDGTTIAFRAEIADVLRPFARTGMPPFGLVVLVLAACRGSWKRDLSQLRQLKEFFGLHVSGESAAMMDRVIIALDRVYGLPENLRTKVGGKFEITQFLLAGCRDGTSPEECEDVVNILVRGDHDDVITCALPPIRSSREWGRHLRMLLENLHRVDDERIRLWTETGLEELIRPAPLPEEDLLKVPVSPRRLLDDLAQDPELRGIARVARHLMAIVHLPRPIDEEQELPLGGVSDITNRGAFDRLLLSELAHDNDTLMVRVALNEALYLRRERPPATPPRECGVLVDSGLRMWGVPRVFATAVALSLSLSPERTSRVFRASGNAAVPIELTNAAGLRSHLSVLNPHVHPGESLAAFAEALGDVAHDAVLVTGEDVLQDPRFRRALSDSELPALILASVSRCGRIRLIERSLRGEKLLLEATLDIDDLYDVDPAPAPKPKPRPLVKNPPEAELPAIMRQKTFPLRLSHPKREAATFRVTPPNQEDEAAFLSITDDRRLMLWNHKGWGGLQLTDELPAPHLQWSGTVDRRGEVACVVKSANSQQLFAVRCKLDGSPPRMIELPLDEPAHRYHVCGYGGDLFLVSNRSRRITMYDVEQGTRLGSSPLPDGAIVARDRFVMMKGGWYAICSTGSMPKLQVVVPPQLTQSQRVAMLFDSQIEEKILAVTFDGNVLDPATGRRWAVSHGLKPPLVFQRVSPDGRFFAVSQRPQNDDHWQAVCFPECRVESIRSWQWEHRFGASGFACDRLRRVRIRSVGVDDGTLVINGRHQYRLQLDADQPRLRLVRTPPRSLPPSRVAHFGRPWRPPERGLKLRRAEWPDGSAAILDSRGLLHLKSSDANIPEFTLVLHDPDVAGWAADGRRWGQPYFIGDAAATPASEVLQTFIRPFIERLA